MASVGKPTGNSTTKLAWPSEPVTQRQWIVNFRQPPRQIDGFVRSARAANPFTGDASLKTASALAVLAHVRDIPLHLINPELHDNLHACGALTLKTKELEELQSVALDALGGKALVRDEGDLAALHARLRPEARVKRYSDAADWGLRPTESAIDIADTKLGLFADMTMRVGDPDLARLARNELADVWQRVVPSMLQPPWLITDSGTLANAATLNIARHVAPATHPRILPCPV